MVIRTFLFFVFSFYLFIKPFTAQAQSTLGQLAASMQPGTWAELTTSGLTSAISSSGFTYYGASGFIIGDANNGAWDPAAGQMHFLGSDHHGGPGDASCGNVTKWIRYTESTNTWVVMPMQSWLPNCTNHNFHNQSNMDPARGEFYFRDYYSTGNSASGTWHRYSVSTNTWTPTAALQTGGTTGYFSGSAYFPEMDGMVQWVESWSGSTGTVFLYKRSTNSWQQLGPIGGFSTSGVSGAASATYNPVHKVVWLTGGGTSRNWKLASDGTITELPQAPVSLGRVNRGTVTTVDPASGDFLIFTGDGQFYSFDIQTGAYTLKSSNCAGVPISTCPGWVAGSSMWGVIATPITNHGVVMFVKCVGRDCTGNGGGKVYLYKHAAGSSTPPSSFDFVLSNEGSLSVIQGQSSSNTVTAFLMSGSAQLVNFSVSGLPSGATGTFTQSSCSPACSSTLNVTTAPDTSVGSYTVTVTSVASSLSKTTSFTLTVNASSSPPPPSGSDFLTRCTQPGVVRCFGFDSQTEVNPYISTGFSNPTVDTATKASGGGSLKMTIPSNSPANSSGAFSMNFTPGSLNVSTTDPYPVQFGQGDEFYLQWRQRFSPEFLNTFYTGGGGWKQAIIGEGDRTGVPAYSCTDLEVVTQNTYQLGIPQMYHSCGVKDGHYEGLDVTSGGNIYLQTGAGLNCAYPGPYTEPNCVRYKSNQWMTFQVRIKVGTWYKNDGLYKRDSTIQLWVAEEGQPSRLVIDRDPAKGTGYDLVNLTNNVMKYGKVWLLPYNTGKDPSQVHPTAYTWYDDLIISRNKIADPVAGGGTATNPPAAPSALTLQ